ncbi:MAG: sigma-70 family RNA polymerase sigma factor [Ruminococcus sp.]|nr:sigma-70 family RNA polymerase sigma factor [Ruminococcus sp.]
MTDEKLLQILLTDSENGLELVMSAYSKLAYSIAAGILASEEDRREVVNDTFYKVWRARQDIDLDRASLKSYVAMVARSCSLSKLKTLHRYEPLPDNEADLGIDVDFTSDEAARTNERIIARCVSAMPSPDREIFIGRYYFEKPVAVIAQELGLSERRVEYILSKDKRRLRKALIKGGILL